MHWLYLGSQLNRKLQSDYVLLGRQSEFPSVGLLICSHISVLHIWQQIKWLLVAWYSYGRRYGAFIANKFNDAFSGNQPWREKILYIIRWQPEQKDFFTFSTRGHEKQSYWFKAFSQCREQEHTDTKTRQEELFLQIMLISYSRCFPSCKIEIKSLSAWFRLNLRI